MSKKTREQSQACHWSLWFRRHIVQDCLQEVSHPLQNLSQLNFNQPHFGLAGGSTVLPQKMGHLWRHSTEGEWWVAQVSKDKISLGRETPRRKESKTRQTVHSDLVPGEQVVTEIQALWSHLGWGTGITLFSYSSLPGSSLFSPKGNSFVGFWVAYIWVSMGHSWFRIASFSSLAGGFCRKQQRGA